ncbi:ketopantoate reductase family protein [Piscinibacter sp. XHJ-5]|uniref:ketopantoate reductase family protein n=1 Tax=Piscinibacter sp. XHJ-5 TaxID=3037797 RepID=UPI002452C4BF|nr:ketopantoate reductase family protein [Piscinibacter sp. XHJ-5]
MKILVLGAGAIGGYFGARLVQAGGDVTFLVRERRAGQLERDGLVVRSPHGDFQVRPQCILRAEAVSPFDLVIVACKAYDLEAAIDSVRPAVGPSSHVLPLLNGVAHVERLVQAFGASRVVGGSVAIPATLSADGEVVQLAPLHRIVFGPLPASGPEAQHKLEQLAALLRSTPVDVVLASDMWLELWEKFVGLATLAAMTCLMRAAVADIVETEDGARLMTDTYDACLRVAQAAGHAPREAAKTETLNRLLQRGSALTASMLRDLESGRATEGAHIVGDMLHRAQAAGIEPAALRAAWCHLQSHERRRAREGVS